ncbi:BglG family transcription antiterminator [Halalkalibacterium ligniniphilum]|uniref:BglG family transcription antiterminator n=1 Tax=Halalkalibacterium ligniniphilum TaxID=1134413 RepID=UPI00034B6917|nr:BglG family transcription antiterminator [Halalkalibacterium ligniniphilum]
MYISARERNILQFLLKEKQGTTIQKIADELDVSTRTIQRDLKGIEDILKEYKLSLAKQSGVGLLIQGGQEGIEQLQQFLQSLQHEEYTPEERQMLLLAVLLRHRAPVKLFALADELNVTVATVSNDLTKVEAWLEAFELGLVRKRGYGVEIKGEEKNIRRAMSRLITEHLSEERFYRVLTNQTASEMTTDFISERLLHLMDLKTVRHVQQAVEAIRRRTPEQMADSSYIGLIVHVALAIERIRHDENIEIDPHYLETLRTHKEYDVARRLAKQLEHTLDVDIPDAEVGYMTMHLLGAKLRFERESLLEESNFQMAIRVKQLIEGVEASLGLTFQDESLFHGLLAHVKPAMYRIREQMKIYNPLLDKIKEDYEDLFRQVQGLAQQVFEPLHIPDEEVGFLVMHFGSALERKKRQLPLKALVVCSSGIGSSKLLASRLEKEFPEITTIENASLFELEEKNIESFDLLISTIPLQNVERYFLVKPFLSKQEVARIRDFIDRYHQEQSNVEKKINVKREIRKGHSTNAGIFKKIADVSYDMELILSAFQIRLIEKYLSFEEGLAEICEGFEKEGYITNATLVVESLFEREAAGGLAIPNTSLALFHTRSDEIKKPLFTIYELETPVIRKGMDGEKILVKRILLMLAPLKIEEHQLAFLSYVSALVIDSEAHTRIFEQGTEEEVGSLLSEACHIYLLSIINKGEN